MTKTNRTNPSNQKVEIALYGNREIGHGYLACRPGVDGRTEFLGGDGEPHAGRSLTDCLYLAREDFRRARVAEKAEAAVFAPGGERVARVRLGEIRYYGDLTWDVAPVYQISAEALMAAAE